MRKRGKRAEERRCQEHWIADWTAGGGYIYSGAERRRREKQRPHTPGAWNSTHQHFPFPLYPFGENSRYG